MTIESREGIIHDLIDFGVRMDELLPFHPTSGQLKRMRDSLKTLYDALEAYPIPQFQELYLGAACELSNAVCEEMK